ncbi:MAG: acylphosphatase [Proteobacteria bacterium]|nr:acylphosphatase [Pseudomonadota bacterium]MCH8057712.1 acylphosphatase [Pseudomonadota bacterium]
MRQACRRFLVSGKVQGVWFRESTRQVATRLGLNGSASNLPDGRVEVVAVGAGKDIDRLCAWLRHGPAMARVDEVVEETIDDPGLSGFSTVYGARQQ